MYNVPAAPKGAKKVKAPAFEFAIAGKPYSIPSFKDLITPQELFDLAELPLAEQNGVALQRFSKALPKAARAAFETHEQVSALFHEWQKHGRGATLGESPASDD